MCQDKELTEIEAGMVVYNDGDEYAGRLIPWQASDMHPRPIGRVLETWAEGRAGETVQVAKVVLFGAQHVPSL